MASSNDRSGLRAWELLLRTQASLVAAIGREVEAASGLPLSWYDVLLELSREPGQRLRMTELGERVVLSRSQVSRVVDQMRQHGLVSKTSDPADGRATFAVLTPRGKTRLRSAAPHYLSSIDRHFSSKLDPTEAQVITRALRRVLEGQPSE